MFLDESSLELQNILVLATLLLRQMGCIMHLCLFLRFAAEPAGITLLPSALSTSASFTISLFRMINYSVVYLHCDLSVCPRNHSECEKVRLPWVCGSVSCNECLRMKAV